MIGLFFQTFIRYRSFKLTFVGLFPVLIIVLLFLSSGSETKAQSSSLKDTTYSMYIDPVVAAGIQYDSSFVAKKLRKRGQKITAFGYARFFVAGRNMKEFYPGLAPYERAYGIGDGYREPMLSMTVLARPNSKASFGTELFVFTPYEGGYENNVFSTNLGINFYGNFRTQHGNFGVRAGGIHWYSLSPFTIGVFQILDRFSIFDRTPWEGIDNTLKYDNYHSSGLSNPGDLRWNNQAFQGIILNGAKLPGDINFDLFWGKTQPNGNLAGSINDPFITDPTLDAGNVPNYVGFAGQGRVLPSYLTGGKISKSFGSKKNQTLSYNGIHSRTNIDSIRTDLNRSYQVHTIGLNLNFLDVGVSGELGAGSYSSPTYSEKWGEALMLRFKIPKKYTFIPLDVQVYQISKDFYNQNGEIATNSNLEILADAGLTTNATGAGGQVTLVNQLVHNRRGINLNTEFEAGPAKFGLGWGIAQEMDAQSAVISYVHRINGLALSRIYNPFPEGATGPTVFGPYNRKFSFFRGVSEVVRTTDNDPETALAQNRKYFGAIDIQAKLSTSFLDRDLFFFYLGSFGSVSRTAQAVPLYNENSYLFVQYHEFDMYYEVLPKFILTGYLGIENARGGTFTEWDEVSQKPLDQLGTAIGVGFDWEISKNTGLYIRHRWMEFEDRSFALDKYKGTELTIELKSFF